MRALILTLAGLAAVIIVTAIGMLVFFHEGNKATDSYALSIGGPFTLVDGEGKTVSDQQFRGKWMLVYFGYTHCPDACPTTLSNISVALDHLGPKAKQVVVIFITVDPQRDTPKVMRNYVKAFGPQITGLTGSPEQIAAVEKAYHVYSARHDEKNGYYDMDHSSIVYTINPAGKYVTNFDQENDPNQIVKRMGELIS